jgi:hypothetical protein
MGSLTSKILLHSCIIFGPSMLNKTQIVCRCQLCSRNGHIHSFGMYKCHWNICFLHVRYCTGPGCCFFKFNFCGHNNEYSNEHINKGDYWGFSFPYIEVKFQAINKRYCKQWFLVDRCFCDLLDALDVLSWNFVIPSPDVEFMALKNGRFIRSSKSKLSG